MKNSKYTVAYVSSRKGREVVGEYLLFDTTKTKFVHETEILDLSPLLDQWFKQRNFKITLERDARVELVEDKFVIAKVLKHELKSNTLKLERAINDIPLRQGDKDEFFNLIDKYAQSKSAIEQHYYHEGWARDLKNFSDIPSILNEMNNDKTVEEFDKDD